MVLPEEFPYAFIPVSTMRNECPPILAIQSVPHGLQEKQLLVSSAASVPLLLDNDSPMEERHPVGCIQSTACMHIGKSAKGAGLLHWLTPVISDHCWLKVVAHWERAASYTSIMGERPDLVVPTK